MTVTMTAFLGYFGDFVWNLLRLGAFFMVVPVFGNQLVSKRIRIGLTAAVALAVTPVLKVGVDLSNIAAIDFARLAAEMFFAIGLGFAAMIFFQLFVIAGQFIGMQMGLGFAAMVDPGNGVQVTVWSQFFLMLVTLSFLAINGHLILLEILVLGFQILPDATSMITGLVRLGGWMFVGGILLAIPAVVALLIVNLSFGVMNRSAPQLNVFALGFPFSLVFGLVVIWLLLRDWNAQFSRLVETFFSIVMSFGAA